MSLTFRTNAIKVPALAPRDPSGKGPFGYAYPYRCLHCAGAHAPWWAAVKAPTCDPNRAHINLALIEAMARNALDHNAEEDLQPAPRFTTERGSYLPVPLRQPPDSHVARPFTRNPR